jgi:hypothetical protein
MATVDLKSQIEAGSVARWHSTFSNAQGHEFNPQYPYPPQKKTQLKKVVTEFVSREGRKMDEGDFNILCHMFVLLNEN